MSRPGVSVVAETTGLLRKAAIFARSVAPNGLSAISELTRVTLADESRDKTDCLCPNPESCNREHESSYSCRRYEMFVLVIGFAV